MAMKPINRTKQKRNYLLSCILIYIAILYIGCHIGKAEGEGIMAVVNGLNNTMTRPFDIFPINWAFLRAFAGVGVIPPLLLYTDYLKKRDLRPSVEKGSAKWNENLKQYYFEYAESLINLPLGVGKLFTLLKKFFDKIPKLNTAYEKLYNKIRLRFCTPDKKPGTKNMIFSKEIYLSMDGRKTLRNCNALVIGGSGTGKSRFLVKPNMLQANCSYVITDPSGELLETMGGFLQNQGYEIRVFNLVQMTHSNTYNPFRYVRNEEGILTMINALIKNTTPKGSTPSDPFWESATRSSAVTS